ncbi:pilin N-terminal domain-containing protein [Streptococcus suis]|uniref:pilin N-terminal domain-containing protein n=1 Tax=Streptococcus suis TaxID=1307 RepID=UPI000C1A6505|nr:pilin N-terminal domain-containing protein [Streptococcus suis]MBY5022649.1 isopeptide-forming domain-containing fimbrial protein [Streptococcus suis]
MKKLTKVFSLLTVLLTMFGPLGNLRHLVHADDAHQTKVVVHKVLMNKEDFNNFDHDAKQNVHKYDGTQIQQGTFTNYFGTSAKEIEGVNFKVWKKVEQAGNGTQTGTQLGITGEGEAEHYQKMTDSEYGTNGRNTTTTGAEFTLPNGTYIFVEDKAASPYYNKQDGDTKGSELTEAKAVPFRLVLPVTRPDGTGYFDVNTPLHVYPKNTEDKPTVTKEFAEGGRTTKEVEIGKKVPYKITTTIPKGSSYKTIVWEDLMVEGLDFVENSLVVAEKDLAAFELNTHYTITQSKRGFSVTVTEQGLQAITEASKNNDINITLRYEGILNDSAKVDTEIPNQVTFHYGNRPRTFTDTEPEPVTPNGENKIRVTKNWLNSQNKTTITFNVYEKDTGVKVGSFTMSPEETFKEYSEGLKQGKEYIVVEQPVDGHIPSYTKEVGEDKKHILSVTNNPSDNPPPLVPDKPKVITYGKRFVKTNDALFNNSEKLENAEFVVKNAEGKYLVLNTTSQDTETAWVEAAQKATATVFRSGVDGKFAVKGLKQGEYQLEEIKAPQGYALPSTTVPFTVGPNSWGTTDELTETNFQQVKNKKIIIPQTGGIGTVVFTVVGLSTMVFAFIAMKKRQAEEA